MRLTGPSFWIACAVASGALAYVWPKAPEPVLPVAAQLSVAPASHEAWGSLLHALQRPPISAEVTGRPFAAQGEQAAGPAAIAVAEKPAPPPFPFRYAGRIQSEEGTTFFLARAERVFPVRVGEVHEGFRIDAIDETRLSVTWIPGESRLSFPLAALIADEPSKPGPASATLAAASVPDQPAPAAPSPGAGADPVWFPGTASGAGLPAVVAARPQPAAAGPSTVSSGAPPESGSMPTAASVAVPTGRLGAGPVSSGTLGNNPTQAGRLGS